MGRVNNWAFMVCMYPQQKIFTILPEYEVLRLYDNVPLQAKAQTTMGNRLIYGNYTEGYNFLDRFDNAIMFKSRGMLYVVTFIRLT